MLRPGNAGKVRRATALTAMEKNDMLRLGEQWKGKACYSMGSDGTIWHTMA